LQRCQQVGGDEHQPNNTYRQAKEQAALEQLRQQRVNADAQRRTG
jgi:hypothetical protein